MDAHQVKVPDSVIRFMMDNINLGDQLSEDRRDKVFRLSIKLRNESPSAIRLAESFDRGEISGKQLLDMMGTGRPLRDFLPEAGDTDLGNILKFPAPSGYLYVPESVQIFARGMADRFDELSDDQQDRLHRLLVNLRDGVAATWDAIDMYDRGDIDGAQLLKMMD